MLPCLLFVLYLILLKHDHPPMFTLSSASARHLPLALPTRLTTSSYPVQAKALLNAFLPILKPSPSNKLLTPSPLTIISPARNIFPYRPGMSCNRVLTASNGFVTVVAAMAANPPETKFTGMDLDELISPPLPSLTPAPPTPSPLPVPTPAVATPVVPKIPPKYPLHDS